MSHTRLKWFSCGVLNLPIMGTEAGRRPTFANVRPMWNIGQFSHSLEASPSAFR